MQEQDFAATFRNNFRPLNADLGGLEEKYELRRKFGPEKEFDPVQPYLPFYISVMPKEPVSNSEPYVLHYKLIRDDYANGLAVSPEDYKWLFSRALECVKDDVAAIHSKDRPSHLDRDCPKRLRR